jgi:hypothetical protein
MVMSWHVEAPVWEAYAGGRLDPAAEASVETHVVHCARCRADARSYVPTSTTDAVWSDVRSTITAPSLSASMRLLRALGVRTDDLVVVSAAESILVPWAVAVGVAVTCACLVGLAGLDRVNRDAVFLAMAPLVPVLAVVTSYDALDPLRDIEAPTPYSKLRISLLRATAALAVAVPATAAIGLAVPHLDDLAFAWMLPSLGLTATALVMLTWFVAPVTGAMVAAMWITVVVLLRSEDRIDVLTSPLAQAAFTAAALALAATLVLRTSTLRLQGGDL